MMTKRNSILTFGLILLVIGLLLPGARPAFALEGVSAGAAPAQQAKPTPSDDEVNRIASQMYCPVCENIPLDVCPTQACHDWRELIRQKLADGWSDQRIKDYFATQYGDRVLAEPPRRGLNWVVYLLPIAAIGVGVVIVWRVLVSMRPKTPRGGLNPASGPAAPAQDDPYLARMEEELKKQK